MRHNDHDRSEAIRHLVTAATALANVPDTHNAMVALLHAAMAVTCVVRLSPEAAEEALGLCRRVQSGETELSL